MRSGRNAVLYRPFSKAKEYAINGTFDVDQFWSKDADWSIGSGVATKVAGAGNSNFSLLGPTFPPLKIGGTYRTVYTVVRNAGTVTLMINGVTSSAGTGRSTSGTFTQDLVAPSSASVPQFLLRIQGNSAFDGTVDDVSVKRVHPTTPV